MCGGYVAGGECVGGDTYVVGRARAPGAWGGRGAGSPQSADNRRPGLQMELLCFRMRNALPCRRPRGGRGPRARPRGAGCSAGRRPLSIAWPGEICPVCMRVRIHRVGVRAMGGAHRAEGTFHPIPIPRFAPVYFQCAFCYLLNASGELCYGRPESGPRTPTFCPVVNMLAVCAHAPAPHRPPRDLAVQRVPSPSGLPQLPRGRVSGQACAGAVSFLDLFK